MTHMMDQDFFDWYWALPVTLHKMVKCTYYGQTSERRNVPISARDKMAGQQTIEKRGGSIRETGSRVSHRSTETKGELHDRRGRASNAT